MISQFCRLTIRRFRRSQLFAGQSAAVMAPAGRAKNILSFLFPGDVMPAEIFCDRRPLMEYEVDRAGLLHRFGQSISPGLVFLSA